MSIEARNRVRYHSQTSGTDRVILDLIADSKNAHDAGAYPSIATLARDAKVSESRVHATIKKLVALGELEVVKNGGGKSTWRADRRPNLYIIRIVCPPECDGSDSHRMNYIAATDEDDENLSLPTSEAPW